LEVVLVHLFRNGRTVSLVRWVGGFALAIALLVPLDGTAGERPFEMSASAHVENDKAEIAFELRNISKQQIEMLEYRLPWRNPRSVIILAVNPRTTAILPPEAMIDDPDFLPTVVIDPGETLRGNVRLDMHVRGIDEVSKTTDLAIFWCYEPERSNGSRLGSYGGWLPLSAAAEAP
jgi:hypothetical protein